MSATRNPPPLADLIKQALTARKVAQAAGVSDAYVCRVLKGKQPASKRVRDAAVALTGISEEELFGDIKVSV